MYILRNSTKFLKHRWKCSIFSMQYKSTLKQPWKVLFFGTDAFSLSSLKLLCKEYREGKLIQRLEVVTSSSHTNPVRKYAKEKSLYLYDWPLKTLNGQFDVGIVVSFGHLIPEYIIEMFPLGMINVHASLLPRWRGAAPIIYAIANGDTQTGVSIMKIEPKHFDVGRILSQVPVDISTDMTMPELHEKLADIGAKDLMECLHNLPERLSNSLPQSNVDVSYAPKINPSFASVKWDSMSALEVYNLGRALSTLYPLTTTWQNLAIKLFDIKEVANNTTDDAGDTAYLENCKPGFIYYHKPTRTLRVKCCDGKYVIIGRIGVLKKKVMSASDFNNGYLKKVPVQDRYLRNDDIIIRALQIMKFRLWNKIVDTILIF